MKKLKRIYAIEAEWDTGWKYDNFAAEDLAEIVAALNRRQIYDPHTNYRIARYDRTKTVAAIS